MRRLAGLIEDYMFTACAGMRHFAGCGLLNRHWLFWYDEDRDDFRIVLPNLWHPVFVWATHHSGRWGDD